MSAYKNIGMDGLERCNKKFIHKFCQIIIQSRTGEKLNTETNFITKTKDDDMFGIVIEDEPGVTEEIKKIFAGQPTIGVTFCIEISLKTNDGDEMVLETWTRTISSLEGKEANVGSPHNISSRMGTTLKSLICITRVPPAFRLARQSQATDADYTIYYHMYTGEPIMTNLGDGYKEVKVGSVPTPVGTIQISLAYRTQLMMGPHRRRREVPILVKDDHFRQDSSPRKAGPRICRPRTRTSSSEEPKIYGSPDSLQDAAFSVSPPLSGIQVLGEHLGNNASPGIDAAGALFTRCNLSKDILNHPLNAPFAIGSHKNVRSLEPDPLQVLQDIRRKAAEEVKRLTESPSSEAAGAAAAIGEDFRWNGSGAQSAEIKLATIISESPSSSSSDTSLQNSFVMVDKNGCVRAPFASTDPGSNPQDLFFELKTATAPQMACDRKVQLDVFMKEMENELNYFEKSQDSIGELFNLLNISPSEEKK